MLLTHGEDAAKSLCGLLGKGLVVAADNCHSQKNSRAATMAPIRSQRYRGLRCRCLRMPRRGDAFEHLPEGLPAVVFQIICWSRSCLATSLAELPETSIQVLEKSAQKPDERDVEDEAERIDEDVADPGGESSRQGHRGACCSSWTSSQRPIRFTIKLVG